MYQPAPLSVLYDVSLVIAQGDTCVFSILLVVVFNIQTYWFMWIHIFVKSFFFSQYDIIWYNSNEVIIVYWPFIRI